MNEIILLIILLILSGFFSGAEIALFSLSAEKIHALRKNTSSRKQKQRIAKLELLKSKPNRLLVTILVGNNVVNIASASLATLIAINTAIKLGFEEKTGMVVGIVTGVMTLLILLFGEITPKSLAHRNPIKFALFCAPILHSLQVILFPVVTPLSLLVRKFSGNSEIKRSLTEEELKAAVELSEQEGKIETGEKKLVEKILEFDQHSVEQIMTPRSKMFALPDDTPIEESLKHISEEAYSRIPIYHQNLDEIIGILTVRTLLKEMSQGNFANKKVANTSLLQPLRVPLTTKIDTLLESFQAEKTHLALIYDEYGGLIGLITLEDILEEIFGEIRDESDGEEFSIRRIGKNKIICSAETELEHIENFLREKMKLKIENFPWKLTEENRSVSYFLLKKLEHFPVSKETIEIKNDEITLSFQIKEVDGEQIKNVEVEIK
ncbi:hemolysin family protein [Candidatus Gracilibacteria bacterium]|nr:hemolysin family protein [Candidatus Gracilibacteria bacterium]